MVQEFKEKRNGILDVFNQAKSELEALNEEIQTQINTNNEEAARIAQENKELVELQSGNKSAIKVFARLFGK